MRVIREMSEPVPKGPAVRGAFPQIDCEDMRVRKGAHARAIRPKRSRKNDTGNSVFGLVETT